MQGYSSRTKSIAVSLGVFMFAGIYALWSVYGETILGVTIGSNPNLTTNLVLHYSFDGPDIDYSQSLGEIRDQSGSNFHGNWVNGTSTMSGRIGQAAKFSGYYDYASTSDTANLDFASTDTFTIGLWIKPQASSSASFSGTTTTTYSTAGYGAWVAPTGVTSAIVACWGAGGGGGDNGGQDGGGGGGGGAFASSTVSVTEGTTYTIFIGTGGQGGANGVAGNRGGTSTFATTTVVAQGGDGGGLTTGGSGGLASLSTGTTKVNGGTGGNSNTTGDVGGGGGGAGGPHGAGVGGSNGSVPVSGDGGAGGAGNNGSGGAGGAGVSTTYSAVTNDGVSNSLGGGGGGGGDNGTRGGTGGSPGGGGGGAEANATEGDGANGQCTVTYSATTPAGTVTSTSTILSKSGGTGGGYKLYVEADGDLCFGIDDDSTWGPEDTVCTTGTNFYTDNQWHNVIIQKDGTTGMYLYVDNPTTATSSDVSLTATGNLTNDQPLHLGRDVQGSTGFSTYTGGVDDLRMYRALLSATDRSRVRDLGNTTRISTTLNSNDSLNSGLVGHWTFDGKDVDWSSTTAEIRDRSGSGNHGNATTTMSATSSLTRGVIGQAGYISYTTGLPINMGSASVLDNMSVMTLSVWVKPDVGGTGFIVEKGWNSSCAVGYHYLYYGASNYEFSNAWTSGQVGWSISGVPNPNDWHHITVVYNNSSPSNDPQFYLDGVATTSVEGGTTPSGSYQTEANCDLNIGSTNVGLSAALDDIRIYNRALSADEVKRLYQLGGTTRIATNAPLSGTENGLLGHWTFNGPDVDWSSTTAEIRDRSGNNYHGNATSSMGTSSVAVGRVGQALRFSGTTNEVVVGDVEPGTDFSFVTWFKYSTATSGYKDIITKTSGTSAAGDYWLKTRGNELEMGFAVGAGASNIASASTTNASFITGEWYHVAGTFSDSTNQFALYINGVSYAVSQQNTTLTPTTNSESLRFGAGYMNEYFDGTIDDVRIYTRALSESEIRRLQQAGG